VLSVVQRIVVRALHDPTPFERLRALVEEAGDELDADERARLLALDGDGLRIAGLLVRKLRFERALAGDPELRARCDRDVAAFVEDFRAYVQEVAPTFAFPAEEAAAFCAFLAARRRDGASPSDPP
jgi:hypothetical protein